MDINWDNREEILGKLSKEDSVRFALRAANTVSHLNSDPKVINAIKAAEDWLADPSEKNRKAAASAASAAYGANAAWAAYAAYGASAASAASAAYGAAWSAASAVSAAADDADKSVKPILVKYLRELYLNSLPEEIKNDWLTRAVIGVNYEDL